MAVDKAVANKRRFLFGLKSFVDLVLVIAVVGFTVWASGRYGGQIDLSSGGVNSLSPRTVKLIEHLDQDITITGLFTLIASDIRPHAEKRYEYVSDLLDLYDSTGGARVTTYMVDKEKNPQPARTLLDRLSAKPEYQQEAEPYKAVIEQFPAIQEQLAPLAQNEVEEIGKLLQNDTALESVRELPVIEHNFEIILEEAKATEDEVDRFMSADIPLYGQAMNVIGVHLDQAAKAMRVAQDWMTREGAKLVGISSESAQYFAGAADRYADMIEQIETLKEQSTGLDPLQLEQIYRQLQGGQVVVVETPDAVSVVPQDDVWPARIDGGQGEDGDRREFAGEQGVSSAILRMTQKDRTGVVFVRFAGGPLLTPAMPEMPQMMQQRPPEAPYEGIDVAMKKENFVTAEWNVDTDPLPPILEDVARTVYVVFPPAPPGPRALQNPAGAKSISEEQKRTVLNALGESGMAVFLVGWQPPSMPMGAAGGDYEYGDYLKQTWGIDPKTSAITIQFTLDQRTQETFVPAQRSVTLLTSAAFEWTEHPIAVALKSLPGALASASPLVLGDGPDGVTLDPIIQLKPSDAVWAVTDIQRLQTDFQEHQGTRRYEEDMLPPFALAVAGTNAAGQRIVVISSEQFIANQVLNAGQLMFVGGGIARVQSYPANRDLFINTLHWLTGDAERIAVGPRRGNVPRLDRLEDGPVADFTKVFLVGIWPGVVLMAGAVVWFTRRR